MCVGVWVIPTPLSVVPTHWKHAIAACYYLSSFSKGTLLSGQIPGIKRGQDYREMLIQHLAHSFIHHGNSSLYLWCGRLWEISEDCCEQPPAQASGLFLHSPPGPCGCTGGLRPGADWRHHLDEAGSGDWVFLYLWFFLQGKHHGERITFSRSVIMQSGVEINLVFPSCHFILTAVFIINTCIFAYCAAAVISLLKRLLQPTMKTVLHLFILMSLQTIITCCGTQKKIFRKMALVCMINVRVKCCFGPDWILWCKQKQSKHL